MDIFMIFSSFGGLAFFLFGMIVMSERLGKLAGGKLEKLLSRLTSSVPRSIILGAGITAVTQSSSAVTVMVVGLVSSGVMTLERAFGVIIGSNIGTTVTSWILSLSGLEGESFIIRLLKPESFAPLAAFIGILLNIFGKAEKLKDTGLIMLGFSLLMYGMDLMKSALSPLAQTNILSVSLNSPLLSLVCGAVFTAIIQSSSASVGILQALAMTGTITLCDAVPIIAGLNIGTCATALPACLGSSIEAKRTAALHILFNLIGAAVCLVLFFTCKSVFSIENFPINPTGIAVIHTLFNVVTTSFILPFRGLILRLSEIIIPKRTELSH